MKIIKRVIDNNLTGIRVLFLFVLTNIVYTVMLVITIPKTMSFSNGMKLLDMMPMGYNSEYIMALFESLGDDGRHSYLYSQLPVDMIYPFLFGMSYCLIIGYFLKKINKLDSNSFYLSFMPVIAGIADYFENFGIIRMLNNYPDLSQISMNATNYFSIVKSMTTTVSFIVLIICLIMLVIKTFKEGKTSVNIK